MSVKDNIISHHFILVTLLRLYPDGDGKTLKMKKNIPEIQTGQWWDMA